MLYSFVNPAGDTVPIRLHINPIIQRKTCTVSCFTYECHLNVRAFKCNSTSSSTSSAGAGLPTVEVFNSASVNAELLT